MMLSRREFLRISSLTISGAALAGCMPGPSQPSSEVVKPIVAQSISELLISPETEGFSLAVNRIPINDHYYPRGYEQSFTLEDVFSGDLTKQTNWLTQYDDIGIANAGSLIDLQKEIDGFVQAGYRINGLVNPGSQPNCADFLNPEAFLARPIYTADGVFTGQYQVALNKDVVKLTRFSPGDEAFTASQAELMKGVSPKLAQDTWHGSRSFKNLRAVEETKAITDQGLAGKLTQKLDKIDDLARQGDDTLFLVSPDDWSHFAGPENILGRNTYFSKDDYLEILPEIEKCFTQIRTESLASGESLTRQQVIKRLREKMGPFLKEKGYDLPAAGSLDDMARAGAEVNIPAGKVRIVDFVDTETGEVKTLAVCAPDGKAQTVQTKVSHERFRGLKTGLFYLSAAIDGMMLALWLTEEAGVWPNTAEITSAGLLTPEGFTSWWEAYKQYLYWRLYIGSNMTDRNTNRERAWAFLKIANFYVPGNEYPDLETQLNLYDFCREQRRMAGADLGPDYMQLILEEGNRRSVLMGKVRQPAGPDRLGAYDIIQLDLSHLANDYFSVTPAENPTFDLSDLTRHQPGEVDKTLTGLDNLQDLLNKVFLMKENGDLIITARSSEVDDRFYAVIMFLEKDETGRVILNIRQLTLWYNKIPYPLWFEVDEKGQVVKTGRD